MGQKLNTPNFEGDKEYFWRYFKDTGCDLHPACLECPRPKCKYDEPHWERKKVLAARDLAILKRVYSGEKNKTIAKSLGVHVRTVNRAISRFRDSAQQTPPEESPPDDIDGP